MKKNKIIILLALIFLVSLKINAQTFSQGCLTNSINISTGWDHASNAFYTASSNDDFWLITGVPVNGGGINSPKCAELYTTALANPNGNWPSTTTAAYIGVVANSNIANTAQMNPSSTFFWTCPSAQQDLVTNGPPANAPITFTRSFFVQSNTNENITFVLNDFRGDDVARIRLDNSIMIYNPTGSTTAGAPGLVNVILNVTPGAHTIDIDCWDISAQSTGIRLDAQITSANNVLVRNSYYGISADCDGVAPPDPCQDVCYWKMGGNNTLLPGNNNIFGTTVADDVRIFTDNQARGIITSRGDWGMGIMTSQARLQIHDDNSARQLHISGRAPAISFYNGPTNPGFGGNLGYASSNGHFTAGSLSGDFILRNTTKERSIIFGTDNNGWQSFERMRVDHIGQVGINTISSGGPTAYLHVNCDGNNPEGSGMSDVRFENLEFGPGTPLVIDASGYVYRSEEGHEKSVSPNAEELEQIKKDLETEKEKNELLSKELTMLKDKVNMLFEKVNSCCANSGSSNDKSQFKVYPNPANKEIITEQYVPESSNKAEIIIADMTGKIIKTQIVRCTGICNVKVELPESIASTMILCTLRIDNKVIDTERIVLARD